jgi:hypothetical protein
MRNVPEERPGIPRHPQIYPLFTHRASVLHRCSSAETRQSLLAALRTLNEFNMDGLDVHYSPQGRSGVALTIINAGGNLQK